MYTREPTAYVTVELNVHHGLLCLGLVGKWQRAIDHVHDSLPPRDAHWWQLRASTGKNAPLAEIIGSQAGRLLAAYRDVWLLSGPSSFHMRRAAPARYSAHGISELE